MAKHEITRRSPGLNISGIYAAAALAGVALQTKSATELELADGTMRPGFLTRDVTVAGPAIEELVLPVEVVTPFKAGGQVAIEGADEFEAEGGDFLKLADAGAITANTAVKTGLSFSAGKLCVAQSGQMVFYRLAAQLTPETAGAVRIRVERCESYVVPA